MKKSGTVFSKAVVIGLLFWLGGWVLLRRPSIETGKPLRGVLLLSVFSDARDNKLPWIQVDSFDSGEPAPLFTRRRADKVSLEIEAPCKFRLSDSGHIEVTAHWSLIRKPLSPKQVQELGQEIARFPGGLLKWQPMTKEDQEEWNKLVQTSGPAPPTVITDPPLILTLRATSFEVTDSGGDHQSDWLWLLRPKSVGLQELTLDVSAAPGYGWPDLNQRGWRGWTVSQGCPKDVPLYSFSPLSKKVVLLGHIQVVSDLGLTAAQDALFKAAGGILGALSALLGLMRYFERKPESS